MNLKNSPWVLRLARVRWASLAWITVAVLVVVLALYVVLAGQALRMMAGQKNELTAWAGERIGLVIQLDKLDGEMSFLTPVVHLRGVRLYVKDAALTPGQMPALSVPAIDLEIDTLDSLLTRQPVLSRLRIEGVTLALVEGEDGQFRVRGMPFTVNDPRAEEKLRLALQMLYRQDDILVERTTLSIEPVSGKIQPMVLQDVRLRMGLDGGTHVVAGRAKVQGPGTLNASFAMRFDGEPVVPRELVTDLHVRVQPASLENWLPRRDAGDFWLDALAGGGEAWLHITDGRVQEIRGRLNVDSLAASLEDGRKLEGLLGLATRFHWQSQPDGWTLAFSGLTFRRQGATWPESDGALEWHQGADGKLKLRGMLSRGDLQMIAGFADALPLAQTVWRERLTRIAPQGRFDNLRVEFDETAAPESRWRVRTGFSAVSLRTDSGIPGVHGVSGRVELVPNAGFIDVSAMHTALDIPAWYADPIDLSELKARLVWRRDATGLHVASNRFVLRNGDAQSSGLLSLDVPVDGTSPRLALLGLIEKGKASVASRYLPKSSSQALREWLHSAMIDGQVQRGSFLFHGPIRHDTASLRERIYQMRFQANDLTVRWLPDWPALRDADADVHIENGVVEGRVNRGRLLESQVSNIAVDIRPESGKPAKLNIAAGIDGELSDVFKLFRESPLQKVIPAELQRWQGSGRLQANLHVDSRLASGVSPRVQIDGTVNGATLDAVSHALEISDASGNVRFDTASGFSATQLRGNALGGTYTGSAQTQGAARNAVTTIDLAGPLRMAAVSDWLKLPALSLLTGEGTASLQLRFPASGEGLLDVRSDLRGIAVDAPAPLTKTPNTAMATRLVYTLGVGTPQLNLVYGRQLSASVRLPSNAAATGAVAIGGQRLPDMSDKGLAIDARVGAMNMDAWITFAQRLTGTTLTPTKTRKDISAVLAGLDALRGSVQHLNVQADHLDIEGAVFGKANLLLDRHDAGWLLKMDSDLVAGQALAPDGYQLRGDTAMTVQLDHLRLPILSAANTKQGAKKVDIPSIGKILPAPGAVPRLSLSVQDLQIGDENFGSWSMEAIPDGNGTRLANITGSWRAMTIEADARWQPVDGGGSRTQLSGTTNADDMSRVATAFGFEPILNSAHAAARFDVSWNGTPLDIDPMLLRGTVALDMRDGRFITTSSKSKALRALGVLNFSAWQRRLKLNFSDVYKQGIAFDSINGDFALDQGVLSTPNLVVKGPSGLFEMSGSTNLDTQSLDSRLRVTLPVNSGLYVGCLAGLAACAGIVVAEQLWGDKLQKMTTISYNVKGTWHDPQVEQLSVEERREDRKEKKEEKQEKKQEAQVEPAG